jgi:hypothetical protein
MLGEDYFLMPCPKDMQPLLIPGVPVELPNLVETKPVAPEAPSPVPLIAPLAHPTATPATPAANPTFTVSSPATAPAPLSVQVPASAPVRPRRKDPHQSPGVAHPLATVSESLLQDAGASPSAAAPTTAPALAPLLPTRAPMPVKIVEEPLLVQEPQQAKQPSPNKVTKPVASINEDDRSVKGGVVKPAPAKVSVCQ